MVEAAGRRYVVRTYGCQMNEHDSERIAGLLEADGHDAGPTTSTTPTSSCSTPAASARTPTTSSTATSATSSRSRTATARHPDRRRRLPGPEGPRPHRRAGAARRRRVRHPQRAPGRRAARRAARVPVGSIVEILDETAADDHDVVPRAPCPPAASCPTPAGSRSRSAATTPAPSASSPPCGAARSAAPFDDIVGEVRALAADGVTEVTLLGQNVNSYGRDLTLAQRRAGDDVQVRPLFAELLRAVGGVDGIRRVRYTSPHPKDLRPETIEAMADDAGRVRAPPPAPAGRQRPGARRHAPRLHRRALPRAPGRRPGRRSPTWPSPPTSSSASPARPTTTSSARSRSSPRPPTTAPTRSSTAPGPGTEAAERVDEFVPAEVCRRALRAAAGRRRALGTGPSPRPGRPGRGGAGRGPVAQGPGRHHRSHRAEQARALPADRAAAAGHLRRGPGHRRRAPPPHGRAARR